MDILKDLKRDKNILVQIKGVDLSYSIEKAIREAIDWDRRLTRLEQKQKSK